jgi:hypothetical protein
MGTPPPRVLFPDVLSEIKKKKLITINTEKSKHMLLSRQQNTGQNQGIKIANRCLKMWHSSHI